MKKYVFLSALFSVILITACVKQEIVNDLEHADDTLVAGIASFTIDNDKNTLLETDDLLLTNNSSNAVSYHWDFGNGDTSEEALPEYSYKMHGYYTISLTITDEHGNIRQVSDEILVLCRFGGGDHSF